MLKRLRKNLATAVVALGLLALPLAAFALPASVSAQANGGASGTIEGGNIQSNLKCGTTLSTENTDCNVEEGTTKVNDLITTIVNIFSIIVGLISVIMIIYGGFRYVTSGGDSGNIQTAKNTIIYALVGIVIVAMAQAIIYFVLNEVTTTPEQRQQQREQNSQQ